MIFAIFKEGGEEPRAFHMLSTHYHCATSLSLGFHRFSSTCLFFSSHRSLPALLALSTLLLTLTHKPAH
jgi:hypothetical protein